MPGEPSGWELLKDLLWHNEIKMNSLKYTKSDVSNRNLENISIGEGKDEKTQVASKLVERRTNLDTP